MSAIQSGTSQLDDIFWKSAYRQHGAAVLGFLRRRLDRAEDADDLCQETFVRAIRAGSVREDGNLRAYLLTTALNLVRNRLRRPRLVQPPDSGERDGGWVESVEDDAISPEGVAAWTIFRERLADVLSAMSDPHRRAFELAVLEQRPYKEIAELTGWSLSSVKINIFRARKAAIQALGDELPEARWNP